MNVNGENNEVITLAEVAEYLQLAERAVLRMARRGEIPAAKVASQWRFIRSLVREWLVGQMRPIPSDAQALRACLPVGRASAGIPLPAPARTLRSCNG